MTSKTRLTKASREIIENYGIGHITSTLDRTAEKAQLAIILDGANAAIRAKYPETDMAVLRKYQLESTDHCLKFQFPSGRVDGFRFPYGSELADLPYRRGCGSSDVFPVDAAFEAAYDLYAKLKQANDKLESERCKQFRDFLAACRCVQDVMEVIRLPDDTLRRLGQGSRALVAITPDTVESLKATFAVGEKEAA
jgi:hypothetical protein